MQGEGGFRPELVTRAATSLSLDIHPSCSSAFPAPGNPEAVAPEVANGRCQSICSSLEREVYLGQTAQKFT